MSSSTEIVITKKRGPKPTGKGTLVGVRIQPDLLTALDKYISELEVSSRPEATRYILRQWLCEKGWLEWDYNVE